jgi:hypothetical protein
MILLRTILLAWTVAAIIIAPVVGRALRRMNP